MGNKSSSCRIGVRLEKQEYTSGDVMKGRVYLSLPPATNLSISGIVLRLEGWEYTEIYEKADESSLSSNRRGGHNDAGRSYHHQDGYYHSSSRRGRASKEYNCYTHSETIVRTDFPLVTQILSATTNQAQQYEFPFELPLPQGLPSTLYCVSKSTASTGNSPPPSVAEIKYTVTAIAVSDSQSSLAAFDANGSLCQYSQVVRIQAAPPSNQRPARPIYMEEEIFPVKTCCCFDHGTISLGWKANKDVLSFAQEDEIAVQVTGSNHSTREVSHILVKLVETVTWSVPDHKKLEQKYKQTISDQKLNVSDAWHWRSNNHNQVTPNHELVARLRVTPEARLSYAGRHISVRHTLVVRVVTNGCCTTSPESAAQLLIINQGQPGVPQPFSNHLPVSSDYSSAPSSSYVAPSAPPSFYDERPDPYQMAHAELLPDDWNPIEAEVIVLPEASAMAVASAPSSTSNNTRQQQTSQYHLDNPVPLPTAPVYTDDPRLVQLRSVVASQQPDSLHNQLDTFCTTIQNLTPREYGQLLQLAGPTVGRMAMELASCMEDRFTTRHLMASLWALPPSYRISVLQSTSALPMDLSQHRSLVEQELSHNELMYFRAATNTKF